MAETATAELCRILSSARLDLASEKATQAGIEAVLAANLPAGDFEREAVLGPGDRPDFMVGTTAIEVKIQGARKMGIFRQLQRYAGYDRVSDLILISNIAMGLPGEIGGKPAYFISLGRGWL